MNIRKNIAVSDTGFIFNPLTGDSFSVNNVGIFILQQLKEGKNQQQITESLIAEYELDINTAEKDLYDFFSMLQSYQLTENE